MDAANPLIGHNAGPDMAVTATETMRAISLWMAVTPVIESEEDAREAKVYIDRSKLCVKDLEDERDNKVRPLNTQIREINEHYRKPRDLLQKVTIELVSRISAFLKREEARRQVLAEEARRHAAEAERVARESEAQERDAIASAELGTLDIDYGANIEAADRTFEDYQKAQRAADLAERETKVRLGGGFSRALGLKTKETVTVSDWKLVLTATGLTAGIEAEIVKASRAYYRLNSKWPPGITVTTERKV